MIDQFIKLLELILSTSQKLNLSIKEKASYGTKLTDLYLYMDQVIENGNGILHLLTFGRNLPAQSGHIPVSEAKVKWFPTIYTKRFFGLLDTQRKLMKKINKLLRDKGLQKLFAIYLPKLKPLELEFGLKSAFVLELNERSHTRFYKYSLMKKIAQLFRYRVMIDAPSEEFIRRLSDNLNRLGELSEELKNFILNNFTIKDIG